jgi:Methyltransferase domain
MKTVLYLGAGRDNVPAKHFPPEEWRQIRVDLDPRAEPDIVADVRDLSGHVELESMDAIFSAHLLEHLLEVDLLSTLVHWRGLLKPGGRLLVQVPDIGMAAARVAEGRGCQVIYYCPTSDGGHLPVRPIDLLYGHWGLAKDSALMSHRTGFTAETLGWWLGQAGFAGEVHSQPELAWTLEADTWRNGHQVPEPADVMILIQSGGVTMDERPEQEPEQGPEEQAEEQPEAEQVPTSSARVSEHVAVVVTDPAE